jgi:hypothetical protein
LNFAERLFGLLGNLCDRSLGFRHTSSCVSTYLIELLTELVNCFDGLSDALFEFRGISTEFYIETSD